MGQQQLSSNKGHTCRSLVVTVHCSAALFALPLADLFLRLYMEQYATGRMCEGHVLVVSAIASKVQRRQLARYYLNSSCTCLNLRRFVPLGTNKSLAFCVPRLCAVCQLSGLKKKKK